MTAGANVRADPSDSPPIFLIDHRLSHKLSSIGLPLSRSDCHGNGGHTNPTRERGIPRFQSRAHLGLVSRRHPTEGWVFFRPVRNA